MIANPLIILAGLWLSYRAIFSIPAGQMSEVEMVLDDLVQRNVHRAGPDRCRAIHRTPHVWCGSARVVLDGFADRNRGRHYRDVVDVVSARHRAGGGFLLELQGLIRMDRGVLRRDHGCSVWM